MDYPTRSWLFVPRNSERKRQKAMLVPSDILILDLEDAVSPSQKSSARELTVEYLREKPDRNHQRLYVRINALDSNYWHDDLCTIVSGCPDGILLPKTRSAQDVKKLSRELDTLEVECGLPLGTISIVPIAMELAEGVFAMGTFRGCSSRLAGITWGAEDLIAATGSRRPRRDNGDWCSPYALARSLCLFSARSAGVVAIDTVNAAFRDSVGFERSCASAHRLGFDGILAIHPSQVEFINETFSPSDEELVRAHQIIHAFECDPEVGAIELDGQMLDVVHLNMARHAIRNWRR